MKKNKLYIACPTKVATGGPELLHQLCFSLRRKMKRNAFMYYYGSKDNLINPVHENYKIYQNPYTQTIEDKAENILIVPEVMSGQSLLNNYSNIVKICWWLSVDNFYFSLPFISLIIKIKKKIIRSKTNSFPKLFSKLLSRKSPGATQCKYHMVQSAYAKNYLLSMGIDNNKILFLSDYLNDAFFKIKIDLTKKQNIVTYNPKKGNNFTNKIIKANPDIKFIPLINMSPGEVLETLSKSKLYIDFGNHPGKDRIPREAATLFCCVITNKEGSAALFEDVSIPQKYKFSNQNYEIANISKTIEDCLFNYKEKINDFADYRKKIKKEPDKFLDDLKNIFYYKI